MWVYSMYSMPARPLLLLGPGVQPSVGSPTPAGEQSTGRAGGLEEGRNITVFCFFFLAALCSSRSLVVGWLVGRPLGKVILESIIFIKFVYNKWGRKITIGISSTKKNNKKNVTKKS